MPSARLRSRVLPHWACPRSESCLATLGGGTSPLYTLKTVLALSGSTPAPEAVLGALSLILWTLIIITSVKYVMFAMSIDNDGEGGILALMSRLGIKKHHRPAIIAIGLFGAALIYGDGAITPAISVLSALEGLNLATPSLTAYVLPAAVAILIALFAIQPLGTSRIGKASDHESLVSVDRGTRRLGSDPPSGGVCGVEPAPWISLSVVKWA
jgi:K+ potassium transporter